ncbi:bifunctional diaminohydroxyphosphoribosylaminopyrimidine deaminase/5-amino-6-(5-phosphoribosylamino)uracil reductase RibD [Maledivibacter halophilus]|uniref:Riboflavin biosynthesis protein RibD n=1 Tax=Maledivibacter halophilus TaxID=36842 RepID=A0A1T5M4V2_9FIRM|nr:bifunctional diaminohydroxyphosphoribosylaminopyrimidine deaminase/5-amino-6-(5-phosphoribosylamino)uracil reductase RibD [Maledivibacter halophilus]SKC83262.1 diaminohydroxyphosphoribosylaminopyrimidine deaminase / 5-amino-6-(5-phosphoribosylamino)uracil reductase [Maledivibacter halophilus]
MNIKFMEKALSLAEKGAGFVNPNPMVGCIIVKNGNIIAKGYHKTFGGNHAEIEALNSLTTDPRGATMYVTLEPCCHYGKTPPCVNAIIESGIKKVAIGMLDPNPLVAGKGVKILREEGVEVITNVLEEKASKLNEIFIKYITTGSPFCLMKSAMSLDGKIATKFSDSKWITCDESRRYVHKLRHRYTSIMVGINTVLVDNPLLTVRIPGFEGENPIRIIVDSKCRIPLEANVVKKLSFARTIIATTNENNNTEKIKRLEDMGVEVLILPSKNKRVDLNILMKKLGEKNIDSVLLEGGGTLNYSALKKNIVDKVNFFIAPKIIGGSLSKTPVEGDGAPLVDNAFLVDNMITHRFGQDIMIEGYVGKRRID